MVMEFDWITIAVAIVLAIVAWKVIKGLIKFAAIAVILGGAAFVYTQGYVA